MKLSTEDLNLFFKLHPSFLFYCNSRLGTMPGIDSIDQFMNLSFHNKNEIRNASREHPELLSDFVKENPFDFNNVELAIIKSWHYAVDGSFYLLRFEADHALFLDTGTSPKVYGVVSLNNDFKNILGENLPIYVKTVLLPFKNQIIYDGFIFTYPVTFDEEIRQEMEADLENWLTRHGVITQLPFIGQDPVENNEDLLRYYLRSHRNREVYSDEIADLMKNNEGLKKLYFELIGKLDARDARKYFRDLGIRDVWCAVLEGKILTTGKSRDTVIDTLNLLLPKDRRFYPFIFHFKG